jgi:Protein of unknown function (DUF2924)
VSALMSPALPGPEVVEAPVWAPKHRRSISEDSAKTGAIACWRCATAEAVHPTTYDELSQRIAALNGLTAQQLRDEWRRLYRGQPPRLSRDLLIRTIAYRIQELAYGGLSKAIQRKLDGLTKELKGKGSIGVTPGMSLRPGTRLVREWRGRTHTVAVTENGFEYAGKTFPSLTKIAHAITGAHWSGPRFFGLIRRHASNGQLGSDAAGSPDAEELANG